MDSAWRDVVTAFRGGNNVPKRGTSITLVVTANLPVVIEIAF
jgi:hypothetical protein